jgi:hypothetical protein
MRESERAREREREREISGRQRDETVTGVNVAGAENPRESRVGHVHGDQGHWRLLLCCERIGVRMHAPCDVLLFRVEDGEV